MKITRIEDVYTVPKTEADWKLLESNGCVKLHATDTMAMKWGSEIITTKKDYASRSRTEIPVDRFLDLLNDNIAPWRLEEVGFEMVDGKFQYYSLRDKEIEISWSEKTKHSGVALEIGDEAIWLDITTFTELLQMMKFGGWKNEEQ